MSEVLGIDVSHYQGEIDWHEVSKDNKKFAILKCQYEAQSHRKDEYFERNYQGAGENGLSRGVYIYIARASMADPEADAKSLLNHLAGRTLEYGIWLDLEDKTVEAKGKAYIRDIAYIYADIFRAAGYYVGIYCNKDWYSRLIHNDLKRDFDFWIARYPSNDTGKYNPTSSLKPSKYGVAWQYSSQGFVTGVKTRCDLDVDFDGIINLTANASKVINGNPYPEPTRTLKRTCTGDDVKWLQYELIKLGYNIGKLDGVFGQKTYSAVCLYQKTQDGKLSVDGIVGKYTLEALQKAL
ncbi:MAG: peptidoglycan-binding protein [Butyrivibrio sp.]|uniref:GH25 family lysozyme n=1 Tax=Butyrivibrio sp. TaxID=28121 RepID=UPI001B2179B5|nr:GH25 family lysozyme [Butyrivibrio sp.]MBO6239805.1 peptidoglycan-binding protein [Butyrivibrio sp.]